MDSSRLFPFLTLPDPLTTGEGALDPLGLATIEIVWQLDPARPTGSHVQAAIRYRHCLLPPLLVKAWKNE